MKRRSPFHGLKLPLKPMGKTAEPQKPPPPPARQADADEALFFEAMNDVVPLVERPAAPVPSTPIPRQVSDEAESLAVLSELVSGAGPFDIADTDEFIQAKARDLDPRVLKALRRGEYAVQGHLDLHGMTRTEAHQAVDAFIQKSRLRKKRCVLLIHGRGLNSKDQIPVLKEQLKGWLQKGRLGRSVLAFASARPHDGGAGALYVLLRRLHTKDSH
jgi:DNA-nicking Smr family endonuclease